MSELFTRSKRVGMFQDHIQCLQKRPTMLPRETSSSPSVRGSHACVSIVWLQLFLSSRWTAVHVSHALTKTGRWLPSNLRPRNTRLSSTCSHGLLVSTSHTSTSTKKICKDTNRRAAGKGKIHGVAAQLARAHARTHKQAHERTHTHTHT